MNTAITIRIEYGILSTIAHMYVQKKLQGKKTNYVSDKQIFVNKINTYYKISSNRNEIKTRYWLYFLNQLSAFNLKVVFFCCVIGNNLYIYLNLLLILTKILYIIKLQIANL